MSELTYPKLWWILGSFWIALVAGLSLMNLSLPQVPGSFGDKVNHALAYGFLMGWFGQLARKSKWLPIAFALVMLGTLMEVLQGMLPYRWFDIYDGVANSVGVGMALLVLYFGGNRILISGEGWFESIKR